MKIKDKEKEILEGKYGFFPQWAIKQQIKVGEFFDADQFIQVSECHLCADTESVGEQIIEELEQLYISDNKKTKVIIPSITDPRGTDPKCLAKIGHDNKILKIENKLSNLLSSLGFSMTNTCINYQVITKPSFGQSLAYGDTGSVIFANSICGARSNFEGGPAALAASLTGLVPEYGFHLDHIRKPNILFNCELDLKDLSDYGALGAFIGRSVSGYWDVPLIKFSKTIKPTTDELKHLGASLASYGSIALFHIDELTPEFFDKKIYNTNNIKSEILVTNKNINKIYEEENFEGNEPDIVVFSAPQLSENEVVNIHQLLGDRKLKIPILISIPPAIKILFENSDILNNMEKKGVIVVEGGCFYQMYANIIRKKMGWNNLISNSAKLVNILKGYGYKTSLRTTKQAVESAIAGKLL